MVLLTRQTETHTHAYATHENATHVIHCNVSLTLFLSTHTFIPSSMSFTRDSVATDLLDMISVTNTTGSRVRLGRCPDEPTHASLTNQLPRWEALIVTKPLPLGGRKASENRPVLCTAAKTPLCPPPPPPPPAPMPHKQLTVRADPALPVPEALLRRRDRLPCPLFGARRALLASATEDASSKSSSLSSSDSSSLLLLLAAESVPALRRDRLVVVARGREDEPAPR